MASKKDEIRKGPWKSEEDQVLLNHVKKHGPREWSSIRSKGLLQRTGKSCRLRWVNKLRPGLKNGCKFTAEEERIVIELQSQFGNKWAKIATFLPGRTDNDVKNFWSSRKKRLARILQASTSSSSSSLNFKSHKAKKQVSVRDSKSPKAPASSSYSMEEESSARAYLCSSSYMIDAQPLNMVQLPLTTNLIKDEFDIDSNLVQVEPQQLVPFQPIPQPQPQPELAFFPESTAVLARLEDPYPFGVFGPPETANLPLGPPFFDPASASFQNPRTPDIFFDDFPADMFDSIEQLPSP